LTRKLSIFSLEGLLLRIPVSEKDFDDWLKSKDSLSYPHVPDIPGPDAWDSFACSFIKRDIKETKTDVLIFSEIHGRDKFLKKRINFLLKTIGINEAEIITNVREVEPEFFYKQDVDYYLSCSLSKSSKKKYEEVNLYIRDYEISEILANHIIQKFSLTAVIHDLYSS